MFKIGDRVVVDMVGLRIGSPFSCYDGEAGTITSFWRTLDGFFFIDFDNDSLDAYGLAFRNDILRHYNQKPDWII